MPYLCFDLVLLIVCFVVACVCYDWFLLPLPGGVVFDCLRLCCVCLCVFVCVPLCAFLVCLVLLLFFYVFGCMFVCAFLFECLLGGSVCFAMLIVFVLCVCFRYVFNVTLGVCCWCCCCVVCCWFLVVRLCCVVGVLL